MTTKYSPPELRPKKWDIVVVIIVILLAGAVALGFYGPKLGQSEDTTVVISMGGEVVERIPMTAFPDGKKVLTHNGYTLELCLSYTDLPTSGEQLGVYVLSSDCPTQDCVHTGRISRTGQSIVCLPAQIVIHLEGASDDGAPDIVVG